MAERGAAAAIGGMDIPDLGALRRGDDGPGGEVVLIENEAFYANDFEPAFDPGGVVTIEFFYRSGDARTKGQRVSMPMPVLVELGGVVDQVQAHIKQSMLKARERLVGSEPQSMEAARAARDQT